MRKAFLFFLSFMLAFPGTLASETDGTNNFLSNPSLGEWNQDGGIANWTGEFSRHTDRRTDGLLGDNASVRARPYYDYARQRVKVKSNETYKMEAWFRVVESSNGTAEIRLDYNDTENTVHKSKEIKITQGDGWQSLDLEVAEQSNGMGRLELYAHRGSEPHPDVAIGAAWFSEQAVPDNWPMDENGTEEDDEEEESGGGDGEQRIEINSADQKELQDINNIGPTIAERVVEDCSNFYSLAHLIHVKGLGETTVKEIMERGKAYVSPPEDSWDLSEDVCSDGKDGGRSSVVNILDLPDSAESGETINAEIQAYRDEIEKERVYGYIEDREGNKISRVSTVRLGRKNTEYELNIPVTVKLSQRNEQANGSYEFVARGLGAEDRKQIRISGTKNLCPEAKDNDDTKQFELFEYDERVKQGKNIESTVILRNGYEKTKNFTVYSYLFEGQRCLNKGGWTGNEKVVEIEPGGKEIIVLENYVKEALEGGDYDFNVRIRDEADLSRTVKVVEVQGKEKDKEKEEMTNNTQTPAGESYRRRGPLESLIYSIKEFF